MRNDLGFVKKRAIHCEKAFDIIKEAENSLYYIIKSSYWSNYGIYSFIESLFSLMHLISLLYSLFTLRLLLLSKSEKYYFT